MAHLIWPVANVSVGCLQQTVYVLQALAAHIDRTFFKIDMSNILGRYMGESEKGMKEVFNRAQAAAPSLLFFDEVVCQY